MSKEITALHTVGRRFSSGCGDVLISVNVSAQGHSFIQLRGRQSSSTVGSLKPSSKEKHMKLRLSWRAS
ncbi:hypothetical protein ATANTOWER_008795 [Ataeniobius toweri]|uniref:Uncharacterized protein n=1 Tax=Ataeniobius toweri TaxID=208326 RepID=A0ABU7AEH6_9TELE|nr:hypothetical protein [Ataeniobius toweri]